MQKFKAAAVLAAILTLAACDGSGSQKPASQADNKAERTKQATTSNNGAVTEKDLTAQVETLTKSRDDALARYNTAVAAYEKVRDEIIRRRAELKTAQENGKSTSVEQLTEALKPLSKLEAGAVAAHKELVVVSDEFAKKSAELAALRKKM